DVFMTYRTTGLATYRNYDFFGLIEGLNFAAQYQGKNERTDNSHLYGADYTRANGDGFGISSTYVYDGFGIGAVYTKSDRTNAQERAAANPLNASGK
ncbi:porin, partial [Shigella sonnei]